MRSFVIVAIAGILASTASTCEAALALQLSDGTATITVTDGGAGDANGLAGVITIIDSVGDWSVNVTTGISKDVLGSASFPMLDLSSVNVSTDLLTAETLTIKLTDTDFTGPVPGFEALIGGTTDGTVTYTSYADAGNGEFGTGDPLVVLGPFGAGAFSGDGGASSAVPLSGLYSLTLEVVINHGAGKKSTSFDAELTPLPEPTTLAIWGLGALGMVVASRFRRRAA